MHQVDSFKKNIIKYLLASFLSWLVLPLLTVQASSQVSQNFTVKLKDSSGLKILQIIDPLAKPLFTFSRAPVFQNIYQFESGQNKEILQKQFGATIEYLEADNTIQTGAIELEPSLNDPGFTTNPNDIDKTWGLAKAGFIDAWGKTTGLATTIVAVVDTGVDFTHEDLQYLTPLPGYDFFHNQPLNNRIDSDDNGHGTLITGVIAATPNNSRGIVGTNWQVGIMPIKALDEKGQGTVSTVAQAIVWAADHGANILNLSIGGLGFNHDTTLSNAITYAYQHNVLLVAAVGNDAAKGGGNLDIDPVFPVCDDNGENMVLGVTAVDYRDQKPDFANFGKSCIDVSAPGKRILSTINHDPITGRPVSDAYAYASGSSLAVPFVVGQAALLKSLYPKATNHQLRDRIITTADNIDNFNTIQCAGSPCQGLLGAGRINVLKSLEEKISDIQLQQGDVVVVQSTGSLYYINGGRREPISPFVYNQRFKNITPKPVTQTDVSLYPEGQFATPLDGTLVKTPNDQTVYYISRGLKFPVTYEMFLRYGFQFANVNTLSTNQMSTWLVASLLPPPEGTLVKTAANPTVYWVVGGTLHPITYEFYTARGLNIFPIMIVSSQDLRAFSQGEAYLR